MLDCIVIGAGPGGMVCTKELIEQGLQEVVCLEQAKDVRGVFANAYDGLVLTSSATISMFSDFWIGDGNQQLRDEQENKVPMKKPGGTEERSVTPPKKIGTPHTA
uniref:FAD binding domain-containing protein n=1 Tax=Hormoscilla spongeliae GUM096 TaxID=1962682 RepID=A0A1S6M1M1_9CYAN|nr:FAD binding domain-containing protein [Hormoscilla spongeliae GUM096]